MKTGERIIDDLRFECGLSNGDIARISGVSYTTVYQIATGKRDPGIETLRAIVEGCGLRLVCITERWNNE